MGVGLMVLSEAIMNVLYPNSNAAGPGLLCIMGAASFFVCIVLMENAVLQASGKEKLTMVTMISGGCVKIAVNWFLVARPEINIYGAPVGTLVSYMAMAALNYAFMCRTLDDRPRLAKVFARPLAASVLMGLTAWAIYGLCARFIGAADWLGTAVCMMITVIAAVVVYAVSAVCLRAIVREDLEAHTGRRQNWKTAPFTLSFEPIFQKSIFTGKNLLILPGKCAKFYVRLFGKPQAV